MTTSAIAIDPGPAVAQKPDRIAIWAIALAGCAFATISLVLALTNDAIGSDLGEPLVIALLAVWITSPTSSVGSSRGLDVRRAASGR